MATATMTIVQQPILSTGIQVKNDFSRHPPIEKFITIDGLLKSHAAEAEQKPLICYPKKGVSDFEEYTAAALDKFADSAVDFYTRNGLEPAVSADDPLPVDLRTTYFHTGPQSGESASCCYSRTIEHRRYRDDLRPQPARMGYPVSKYTTDSGCLCSTARNGRLFDCYHPKLASSHF